MGRRLLLAGLAALLLAEALSRLAETRARTPLEETLAAIGPSHRNVGAINSYRHRGWKSVFVPSAIIGMRLAPSAAFIMQGRSLHLTTPQGFAALSLAEGETIYALPKPADTYRVLVLGGSTVFGVGVARPEDSLPALLRDELSAAAPQRRLEVINAGVPIANSAREFLYLETSLLRYDPDLVIAYNGWNDVWTGQELLWRDTSTVAGELAFIEAATVNARLNAASSTSGSARLLAENAAGDIDAALSRSALYRLLRRRFAEPSPWKARVRRPDPRVVEMYAANLARMTESARRNGFKLALFLQPLIGVDGRTPTPQEASYLAHEYVSPSVPLRTMFYAGAEHLYADLSRRHRGDGVCAASLTRTFGGVEEPVYVDSGHLNAAGNRLVAKEMARRLSACGMWPARPRAGRK
jgi:lysophospholipase L1-like esterase